MTKDEALRLALEALEGIKKALEQSKKEPVAWMNDMGTHIDLNVSGRGTPLYTHPLQRTWVGLTDEDMEFWTGELGQGELGRGVIRAVADHLKEKNT